MIVDKLSNSNKEKMIEAPDSDGNCPLHLAVRTNQKEDSHICSGLIDMVMPITSWDNSPILKVLSITNRQGMTAVHEASQEGHMDILQRMWEALSSDDQKTPAKGFLMTDRNRFTCLHLAAKNGKDQGK
jgi:ankyrin repeat protein